MGDEFSRKQKKLDHDNSSKKGMLEPLIVNQTSKTKGTKAKPYEFGSETYDIYSNLKNPFMVGIIASETDRIQLEPINTQNLFKKIEKESSYELDYPLNISAHRKRKLSTSVIDSTTQLEKILSVEEELKRVSKEYLSPEKLKENKRKLELYIDSFFRHFIKRLEENPGELPMIINEIVPLFVEHQIRIRFFEAFRQILNIEDLLKTLKKISSDYELENFELFCSAIFVFYSLWRDE